MENSQENNGELHSLQITFSGLKEAVAELFIAVGTKIQIAHSSHIYFIYTYIQDQSQPLKTAISLGNCYCSTFYSSLTSIQTYKYPKGTLDLPLSEFSQYAMQILIQVYMKVSELEMMKTSQTN